VQRSVHPPDLLSSSRWRCARARVVFEPPRSGPEMYLVAFPRTVGDSSMDDQLVETAHLRPQRTHCFDATIAIDSHRHRAGQGRIRPSRRGAQRTHLSRYRPAGADNALRPRQTLSAHVSGSDGPLTGLILRSAGLTAVAREWTRRRPLIFMDPGETIRTNWRAQ